ncbi:lipoteichoic acid stability factor AuxB [Staphylococcus caprae]|uniref:lipoteichoic acid stability factor AuxB n=1 Tax=Staphylococcus caprae TaxID=29380 RepID=UPI003906D0EA
MSGEQYTQIKRPVSRLTEKVLGWFSWVFLLILTIITMFIALVSFSNDTSIANLESSLNNNELIQQILGNNDLSTNQFVIWLQNGVWAIIVYFIVCLLISFLALISMNIRILSGFLFLLAAVVTIPLVFLVVTLIIPILFFIIAIMMFARRNKVETVPAYYNDDYGQPYYDEREYYDHHEPHSRPRDDYYEEDYHQGYYDEYEQPRDEKENRNTRRQLRKERRQKEAFEAQQYEQPYDNHFDHDYANREQYEETDDKYSQFPKRAVESEYASSQNTEEEPEVMSRQAKYNKKSKKANREDQMQENDYQDNDDYSYGYDDGYNNYQEPIEPQVDPKELKAQRKREKAEIRAKKKEKKKAYNKRMKEKRKNQPSAVNQRRMNYEERRQMFHGNHDDDEGTKENTTEQEDNSENK